MLDTLVNYQIIIFSVGDTKAGTKMGKLQVKNLSDDSVLNCILWEEALNRIDAKIFRTGNKIKIVSGSYNEKYNNCIVNSIELVEEAKLGLDDIEREEKFKSIIEYAMLIKNDDLKSYVLNLLSDNEKEFKIKPAAKLMHHNYLGGLLEHTLECLDYAKSLIKEFSHKINLDFVYAGCILHDFGKIFEYEIDEQTGLIEYNEDFRKEWISHSQWAYTHLMIEGYNEIAKMIAAHHARIEWGAMIDLNEKDLEDYVYFIHHVDDLSAKFGKTSIEDLN